MSTSQETVSGGKFALDNLTYDVITLMYEKSKGLEAFDKYIRDAQGNNQASQLFQQIRQQDQQFVQQLQGLLQQVLSGQGQGSTAGRGSSSS